MDLPPEEGCMWLLAFLGVTVVGDTGTALHPRGQESPVVLIIFFKL